ncbi:ATP-binding cassette domain-containing protein [Paraburkholderia sp. JHI869]|uniref:ABC transporter ATP-binding protein n=1 Tax=Paraburkholderia sp. JHI869 TaxID=3112959 RepID=UPI00317D4D52
MTNNVSFDVRRGEVLGVIGPNGAGKTTLFGLLAGNVEASSGSIEFDGVEVTRLPSNERARLGIGRTFQVPRPFTHMSVRNNLLTAARFGGGLSAQLAELWIDEVLELTLLKDRAQFLAGRLPLLHRKRHELARALALKPKLLLIDEVAAGLTDEEVNEFIDIVRSIRKLGVTVIWIEHVMKTMLTATDRVLALNGGAVLAIGEPEKVLGGEEVKRVYLGA